MHKLLISAFLIVSVSLGVFSGCGTTEDGPQIEVNLNVRNLCNYNTSVENETRCLLDTDCTGQAQVCWFSTEAHFQDKKGFCRQCETDAGCDVGLQCDHGWCHLPCTVDADCETNQFCTGSFCRKPHVEGTEFNFCNRGNKDLVVDLGQVTLHGADDACVFSRLEWSPASGTVTLAPDDCSLYLNVKFTPKDVGEFRGFIKIPNNSTNHDPMLILMCGQAVESVCNVSDDETCPECASCTEADFESMLTGEPTPNCATYF